MGSGFEPLPAHVNEIKVKNPYKIKNMIIEDTLGIGLVTHKDSKYLNSKGEHELFNFLVDQLGVLDKNVKIANLDKYDLESLDIGMVNFISGINIYLKSILITQINVILKSRGTIKFKPLKNTLGDVFSLMTLVIFYTLYKITKRKNQKFIKYALRQANISNNHISILSDFIKQNIEWIIVLEDDIMISNNIEIKESVREIIKSVQEIIDTKIVNLSKSFSDYDLGIENIKIKKIDINEERTRSINLYTHPICNTVCATLYKADILTKIVQELKSMDKYLFIPIDHKLNIAMYMMLKNKEIEKTLYASIEPGVFIQGSLHG